MKIVQVVNAMITNSYKISSVIVNTDEYFFLYDKKYKWSISARNDDEYFLHFYPTNDMTLLELSQFVNWNEYSNFITYKSNEIKTKEATESFRELYQIVISKVFGVDEMFDDILSS